MIYYDYYADIPPETVELLKRGRPNDARAAEALRWTIDRDTGR